MTSDIITRASAHARDILNALPQWAAYHSITHTEEVVEVCGEIAAAAGLSPADHEAAILAAWFHDTGYTEMVEGHEERSAQLAEKFLTAEGYPKDRIEKVTQAILSTRMPQTPESMLDAVVCDADISHIGRKGFFRKSDLMRIEFERRTGNKYSRRDWLSMNIEFVAKHKFHTEYAQNEFRKRRLKNLTRLQDEYREATQKEDVLTAKVELKTAGKALKDKIPERGIETMFRVVPKNHLDLSSMADQKANIMLSTSSIIITILVSLLLRKLDDNPNLVIPTLLLVIVCMATIVFAILATRPKITSGTFSREDIKARKVNLLFFGNFHKAPLEDFEWGMHQLMNDREYLYDTMIKDLYYLGQVLGKKYSYLRICYNVFMYGMIVAVIAYSIAFLTAPPAV